MSRRACLLPVLVVALSLTIGCGGQPPEKEMHQAQGALDAARAAGADVYAADEFKAATQALTQANDAVGQHDYRLALDRALDSRERAQNAAKLAADGKATARTEADRALTAAQAELDGVEAKLRGAETAKVQARLLASPKKTLDMSHASLQEARALFEKGSYLEVAPKAQAATAGLAGAADAIAAASAPPARRRR